MITPNVVFTQIQQATSQLIELGLCNEQNYPNIKTVSGGSKEIAYSNITDLSISLRNIAYGDIYLELEKAKNYNVKMVDGALIQMMYRFDGNDISLHRLAFFPSPELEDFQNDPDIYENDEIYADILKKNIVPFPIRFDFNKLEELHVNVDHAKSHLTLGQYQNCRIPISSPLTPYVFITFILRNFYNTAFVKFTDRISMNSLHFNETITPEEQAIPHLRLCKNIMC